MNKYIAKGLLIAIPLLCAVIHIQYERTIRLTRERDRYLQNSTALLSEVKRLQVDSGTMALDAKTLRLTLDEYKRYRSEDAETIRRLGVRIKNLETAARHEIEVAGPINALVRDTLLMRDTIPLPGQKVEMLTPHIRLSGIIEANRLKGELHIPVTLHQTVWIEYKRRWIFWKRVKAVHQTISSNNPYVEIRYSEYIQIEKH